MRASTLRALSVAVTWPPRVFGALHAYGAMSLTLQPVLGNPTMQARAFAIA